MGFWDLTNFNLILLTKQRWRLLMFLDSLLSRSLKEKYYAHTTFKQASLGNYPSYTWRSIWAAQKLLWLDSHGRWEVERTFQFDTMHGPLDCWRIEYEGQ